MISRNDSGSNAAELHELVERARNHVMTPEEWKAQRRSFIYGQLSDRSGVSREQIDAFLTARGM